MISSLAKYFILKISGKIAEKEGKQCLLTHTWNLTQNLQFVYACTLIEDQL